MPAPVFQSATALLATSSCGTSSTESLTVTAGNSLVIFSGGENASGTQQKCTNLQYNGVALSCEARVQVERDDATEPCIDAWFIQSPASGANNVTCDWAADDHAILAAVQASNVDAVGFRLFQAHDELPTVYCPHADALIVWCAMIGESSPSMTTDASSDERIAKTATGSSGAGVAYVVGTRAPGSVGWHTVGCEITTRGGLVAVVLVPSEYSEPTTPYIKALGTVSGMITLPASIGDVNLCVPSETTDMLLGFHSEYDGGINFTPTYNSTALGTADVDIARGTEFVLEAWNVNAPATGDRVLSFTADQSGSDMHLSVVCLANTNNTTGTPKTVTSTDNAAWTVNYASLGTDNLLVGIGHVDSGNDTYGAVTGCTFGGKHGIPGRGSTSNGFTTCFVTRDTAGDIGFVAPGASEGKLMAAFEYVAASGGGAIELTMQDAAQSQSADNLALTQANTLALADVAQGQAADSLALVQASTLVLADADQAVTADAFALTQSNVLSIDEALQGVNADGLVLVAAGALALQDVDQSQTADNLDLSQASELSLAEAIQSVLADNLTLSAAGSTTLDVQDVTAAQLADALALTQAGTLTLEDAIQTVTADHTTLSNATNLVPQDVDQSSTADALVLTTAGGITVENVIQALFADNADLIQANTLTLADVLQNVTADNLLLFEGDLLVPANRVYVVRPSDRTYSVEPTDRTYTVN